MGKRMGLCKEGGGGAFVEQRFPIPWSCRVRSAAKRSSQIWNIYVDDGRATVSQDYNQKRISGLN